VAWWLIQKLEEIALLNDRDAPETQRVLTPRGLITDYVMGEVVVHALSGIDLGIYRGEFVVLLEPSGNGKSTLINILGGLDTRAGGSALWRDHDHSHATEAQLARDRRNHVGFVFQFYSLLPNLTVRKAVAVVTEIAIAPTRPEEALDWAGLSTRLDHFLSQLSGSEQQRVAIAAAIVKRPELPLCDESTGALDERR
jgi:putative ABC transport system ATP-binding protein